MRRRGSGTGLLTASRSRACLDAKRSFGFNVLRCPRCVGKMFVLATITDPVTCRILEHLGVRVRIAHDDDGAHADDAEREHAPEAPSTLVEQADGIGEPPRALDRRRL